MFRILMLLILLSNLKINASVILLITQRTTVAADLHIPQYQILKRKKNYLFLSHICILFSMVSLVSHRIQTCVKLY